MNNVYNQRAMLRSNIFIFRYTDSHSAMSSSITDYNIGAQTNLVGSNRNLGRDKRGFVLVNDEQGNYLVGYVGLIGEKVHDEQPWRDNGGRHWKHIYTTQFHSDLIDLNTLCTFLGVQRDIFRKSVHMGHVRRDYIIQFNIVLQYFQLIGYP